MIEKFLKMHRVFVYGTLKRGEPNHMLMTNESEGTAVFVGKAQTVEKWPLVIASLYNIPYLLYCKGSGNNVIGEIYDVDDQKLIAMDQLEGHPVHYVREETEVQLLENSTADSTIIKCWIYFLKDYKPHLLELPQLEDYSSNGPHNLPYLARYKRNSNYNVVADVKVVG